MKFKWTIFVLCFVFIIPAMAAEPAASVKTTNPTAPKAHHRKKKRPKAAPKATAPAPKVSSAAPSLAAEPAKVPEVKPAEPRTDTFHAWLEGIKKRLGKSETRSNKLVAVAAVRGDEVSDPVPLYWKGKKADAKVDLPEQKDFEIAIDAALAGDKGAAKERLQSFLLAYPKSSLAPDAQETLKRLEAN